MLHRQISISIGPRVWVQTDDIGVNINTRGANAKIEWNDWEECLGAVRAIERELSRQRKQAKRK